MTGEVFRDLELIGAVPPGAVHQDNAMGLCSDVAADLVEMHLHGARVGEGEHEGGARPPWGRWRRTGKRWRIDWSAGRRGRVPVFAQIRAWPFFCPNLASSWNQISTRLVLGRAADVGRPAVRGSFLNASMTRASCLGCCGRPLMCEKDIRRQQIGDGPLAVESHQSVLR